ncbi:hypothetical protein B0H13DRAFT_1884658 [Mycena leptocephala]|nr:hypothetical protein B0H13DRAFT_1884658 [Mycena leptocephala]
MSMNNMTVASSLASDLVLGMDWLLFMQNSASATASDIIVYLASGPLEIRRLLVSLEASSFTTPAPVAPFYHGNTGAVSSPTSSVAVGGPGAVLSPSLMPRMRGINVVAVSTLAARTPISIGVEAPSLSIEDPKKKTHFDVSEMGCEASKEGNYFDVSAMAQPKFIDEHQEL